MENELALANWCVKKYKKESLYFQKSCRKLESEKKNFQAGLKEKNHELLEVEKEALGLVATTKKKIGSKRNYEENKNKGYVSKHVVNNLKNLNSIYIVFILFCISFSV